jgi:putative adhesin
MSNQEMQFADPDWKPSQQLDPKTNPGETSNPQPINTDFREQNQWRTAPPSPAQQEGYTGLRPYAAPPPQQMQGGNYRQRQYRRRGRGPWFWIILAIIIISVMSGGFGSRGGFSFGPDHSGNNQVVEKHDYTVNGRPTIIINDTNGTVQVNVGSLPNDVTIQTVKESGMMGNANNIKVNLTQDTNLINASVLDGQPGSVDFNVTVPQGADLQLLTNSGDINVTGVTGKMTLTTESGSINASNDVISGSSSITTTSGDIKFDGTIATTGTYQFQTNNGNVDLTVPSTPPFSVNATTSSGSITSDFSTLQPSTDGSGSSANGIVGGGSSQPGAKLTINVVNGDISLRKG